MSAVDTSLPAPIKPTFDPSRSGNESGATQAIINALNLAKHPEGGYFAETDRDQRLVANPFLNSSEPGDVTRCASTSIYYYLTPASSFGAFHRNKGRTVHTLHRGRGRYVLIHVDEVEGTSNKARVETFVVGQDIAKGERLQWVVEGGKYKASFLLPDSPDGSSSDGLLISEVSLTNPTMHNQIASLMDLALTL